MDRTQVSQKRRWWTLGVCTALGLAVALTATVNVEAAEDTPLVKAMEIVGSNYKKIRRQARSKKFDATTLKLVQDMQTQSLIAMHQPIPRATKAGGAAGKAMQAAYRKSMAKMITKLLELEILLDEGKSAEAAKIMMEDLGTMKKSGHEKFTEEE
jgi:soluble cytochrome b562